MADEIRFRLKKDPSPSEAATDDPTIARLERVKVRGRVAHALILPDRVVARLDLDEGDRFVIEGVEPMPWTVEFKYAVDAVAKSLELSRHEFVSVHPIGLLNTPEGEREYWRTRTEIPDLPIPRCRKGLIVKSGSMHFAYLNPDVWESGKDIVPTSVHLILHVLYPEESEEDLRGRESAILGRPEGAARADADAR